MRPEGREPLPDKAGESTLQSRTGGVSAHARKLRLPFGFDAARLRVRLSNYDRQLPRPEMTLRPYEAIVFEEV